MSDHLKPPPAPHRQRGMDHLESDRRRGRGKRRRGESIRELHHHLNHHHRRLLQALQRSTSRSLNPLPFQSVQPLRPKQMTWKALTWRWTTSSWNQRWSRSKNILRTFSKLKVRARVQMLVKIVVTTRLPTATLKLSMMLTQKMIPKLKIPMSRLAVKSTERKLQRDRDH